MCMYFSLQTKTFRVKTHALAHFKHNVWPRPIYTKKLAMSIVYWMLSIKHVYCQITREDNCVQLLKEPFFHLFSIYQSGFKDSAHKVQSSCPSKMSQMSQHWLFSCSFLCYFLLFQDYKIIIKCLTHLLISSTWFSKTDTFFLADGREII